MAIWHRDFPMHFARLRSEDTLAGYLGIELVEAGDDYLKGRLRVEPRTSAPGGMLHGGATLALAETLASWAATACIDDTAKMVTGLESSANHLRGVATGYVTGVAKPMHLGRSSQVWEVRVTDAQDRLVSVVRLTFAVVDVPARAA